MVPPGSTSSPAGKNPPPGLATRTPWSRKRRNRTGISASSTYHANECQCCPNREWKRVNGIPSSAGSEDASIVSSMKSPTIPSDAQRRSLSAHCFFMNHWGEKRASYQESTSSMSSTTWIRWKNSRIGMGTDVNGGAGVPVPGPHCRAGATPSLQRALTETLEAAGAPAPPPDGLGTGMAVRRSPPTALQRAGMGKVAMTELNQRVTNLTMEPPGADAMPIPTPYPGGTSRAGPEGLGGSDPHVRFLRAGSGLPPGRAILARDLLAPCGSQLAHRSIPGSGKAGGLQYLNGNRRGPCRAAS